MTPAEQILAAAAKLRPSSPAIASRTVAVRVHPDVVEAMTVLLVAVANDPSDESLNEPGSARHGGCDRTVCPAAAALAVARAIIGTEVTT